MSKALYHFENYPDHKARLTEWRDRWIANAMSTTAMTDDDRAACREAALGLYAAAGLPAPKHIVFVSSPFVLRFAGGFAAAIWHLAKHRAATWDATWAATRDATWAATWDATRDATRDATGAATGAATWDATRDATEKSEKLNLENWYVVPGNMRQLAADIGIGDFGLQCAAEAWRMWSEGNQDSGYDAFLSFFQDVAQLPLDYSKYRHWRTLTERSGPRIMHADFCIISDRPSVLKVDENNQPHCEDGPFCAWRDGSALYSWHGTRVPARWIEQRESLDPVDVLKEVNVEAKAAGIAIVGMTRLFDQLGGKIIDDSGDATVGKLGEVRIPGLPQPGRYLIAECPRNGTIMEGVPMVSDIDGLPINTAIAAQAWRIGDPQSEYTHPPMRT